MIDVLAFLIILGIIFPSYVAVWYSEFEYKLINSRKKINKKHGELK